MLTQKKIQIKLKTFLFDLQAFRKILITRIHIKHMRIALSMYKHKMFQLWNSELRWKEIGGEEYY